MLPSSDTRLFLPESQFSFSGQIDRSIDSRPPPPAARLTIDYLLRPAMWVVQEESGGSSQFRRLGTVIDTSSVVWFFSFSPRPQRRRPPLGASSGSTDLLPAPGTATNWTASLLTDSGRDSDLIFRFDGRQAAKIPDRVVPQNLTDHFTIATWMKHGPSPGLRAEKETLLCNSDKTGESEKGRSHRI